MAEIVYTNHLKMRLDVRKIPENYPRRIYKDPDRKYYDNVEDRFIRVKKLQYKGKNRYMMIAYEKGDGSVKIVTIHPISQEQMINREIKGRWEPK